LNGKAVPATAVSSLPVVAGDEIVTASSSAMIYFADRSRATIGPNSRVKLEACSSSVALHVLSGSVDLNRALGSRLTLLESTPSLRPGSAANPNCKPPHPGPPKPPPPCPPPPPRSGHCPPNDWDCDKGGR
jgi:hypothetical protein